MKQLLIVSALCASLMLTACVPFYRHDGDRRGHDNHGGYDNHGDHGDHGGHDDHGGGDYHH